MASQQVGVECEALVKERADFFSVKFVYIDIGIHLGASNRQFPSHQLQKKPKKKESDEYAKVAPKINSGATDGGILYR